MTNDLHKKLEKAANDFADKHGFRIPYDGSNNFYDTTDVKASKDGFLAGAELGYKEAITQAKEWLKNSVSDYTATYIVGCSKGEFITNFETNMNKLWEEKK